MVNLNSELSRLMCRFPSPDVVVIHLGGNDVGQRKTLDIIFSIRDDLLRIHLLFPTAKIIFSDIIQRLVWLPPFSRRPLEKIRKRINRAVSKLLVESGIFSFRHTELEGGHAGLYRSDGVHLSDIGLDIFNADLGSCVESAA